MCIIWLLHFEATHLNVMRCLTRRWRYYGSALAFWGPVKLSGNLSAILSNQPAINLTRKHEILKYIHEIVIEASQSNFSKKVAEDNLWPTHISTPRKFGAVRCSISSLSGMESRWLILSSGVKSLFSLIWTLYEHNIYYTCTTYIYIHIYVFIYIYTIHIITEYPCKKNLATDVAVAIAYLSQSKVLTHPKDVFEPRGNPKLSKKDNVLKPMGSGNPRYFGKYGYTMLDHFGRYFISMEHFDPSPCGKQFFTRSGPVHRRESKIWGVQKWSHRWVLNLYPYRFGAVVKVNFVTPGPPKKWMI